MISFSNTPLSRSINIPPFVDENRKLQNAKRVCTSQQGEFTKSLCSRPQLKTKQKVNKRRKNRRQNQLVNKLIRMITTGEIQLGDDYDPDVDEYVEDNFGNSDTELQLRLETLTQNIELGENRRQFERILQHGLQTERDINQHQAQKNPAGAGQGDDLPPHWRLASTFDFTTPRIVERLARLSEYGEKVLGYKPRDWQLKLACLVLEGFDVVVQAATGSGKSTVFHLILAELRRTRPNSPAPVNNSTMILITPITGLLQEQKAKFDSLRIPCFAITSSDRKDYPAIWSDFMKGKFRVLLACPEALLSKTSHFWLKVAPKRDSIPFIKNLRSIVIDEVHCAYKYGESGYRQEYAMLGEFRNFFKDVPFCCLSATIPPNVREYVHASLELQTPSYLHQETILRFVLLPNTERN